MESTDAGAASRFISETIAAWVYFAIMWRCRRRVVGEERRQAVAAGDVEEAVVRRSEIEATSAATIARKSST